MIALVLGGTRSGKSAVAERLAGIRPPVTYVATALAGVDSSLDRRIAAHRARRPAAWRTLEAGTEVVPALRATPGGTVLLDSLGTWLAAHPDLTVDTGALVGALRGRAGDTVVVSEEVGLAVHPATAAGRRFTDALGDLNQAVAEVADDVLLVVAGRVLRLDRPGGLVP